MDALHAAEPLTSALRAVLARHPNLRLALLFGSVAAGRASADSDLDIAVLADASDTGQPVPRTMGETFTCLAGAGLIDANLAQRLRRAVGFRNLAVHQYEAIDWAIVPALTGEPLADFDRFDRFARAVADVLAAPGAGRAG